MRCGKLVAKVKLILVLSQLCYSCLPTMTNWTYRAASKGVEKVTDWKQKSEIAKKVWMHCI